MNNIDRTLLSLLNLSSSQIESIHTSSNSDGIETILVVPYPITYECPYCGNKNLKSNGFYTSKTKTSIDATKYCIVYYKIKRHICRQCSVTFMDNFHIAPKHCNLSYATIRKIMTLLSYPSMTFKQVARLLDISPQSVLRTFDKYCHVAPISFPEVLCMDEVYTKNSDFDSKFSCIFYDFFQHRILDVTPCRRKDFLLSYLEKFSEESRNNVRYVCMDMYSPYKDIVTLRFKKAIICVDSFHVIKALNDCVFKVRMRVLAQYDSSSNEYYLLKNWKNLFLSSSIDLDNVGKYNKRFKRYMTYRDLLQALLTIHPDLAHAYDLKERYITFNNTLLTRALLNKLILFTQNLLTQTFLNSLILFLYWIIGIMKSLIHLFAIKTEDYPTESLRVLTLK